MTMEKRTTITVSYGTWLALVKLRRSPKEKLDTVIKRLVEQNGKVED